MTPPCGICGLPLDNTGSVGRSWSHPIHTDAEVAETKAAVDAAAQALTFLFLMDAAHRVMVGA